MSKEITIALAGQPNTGKSTLFNALTGANQHVGNWPGKTVEKKKGHFIHDGHSYSLIDLPGTYSLTANSAEEIIATSFIIGKSPDVIVVVVDASQLSRSLYLVAELTGLDVPVIVALNMMDVAEKNGLEIDIPAFTEKLGCPVISLTASNRIGLTNLTEAIKEVAESKKKSTLPTLPVDEDYSSLLTNLQTRIADSLPKEYSPEWVSTKLLENDNEIKKMLQKQMQPDQWQAILSLLPIDSSHALVIANARYDWISTMLTDCVTRKSIGGMACQRGLFDKVATHPLTGVLLGILIIITGFILAACLGFGTLAVLQPLAASLIRVVQDSLSEQMPIVTALISQGIIPGVFMISSVSGFIFGVLLLLGFLENIGYLPRMAYVADIFMSRIGLHGKSFIPLFMGFGCNIAAVMGCRVIETMRQRVKTIVISSHIPCPGAMVTIAFIVTMFFEQIAPFIIIAVVVALALQIFITSKILDYTVLQGVKTGMMMELPPYHLPNWRTIWNYVWLHFKSFFQKAGSLIGSIVILVWALSYFPTGNMADSYLASVGKTLEPVGMLMGMDWRLLTCLFVATFSKEAALVSMAVIYGIQVFDGSLIALAMDNITNSPQVTNTELGGFLADSISRPSALAFIFAILFSVPCFSTVGVIFFEIKSLKWTIGLTIYYTSLSFFWGIVAYRAGLLLFQ